MIEVEVKARIPSIESVKATLERLGAEYQHTRHIVDKIYGRTEDLDENHKLVEGSFSGRIRAVNNVVKVQFKEILRGKGGLEFGDTVEDIETGNNFLTKLGYKEAFTIDKIRITYILDGFTICLDDVQKLGTFIEIEVERDTSEGKDKVMQECIAMLSKVAPEAEIIKEKYGDLMQELLNRESGLSS